MFIVIFIAPTAAPLNIKANPISSQIIRVSWTLPPHNHQHGLIKGYKVRYSEKFSALKKEKVVRNVHFAELTNLKRYTEYSIAILAFTDGGDGKLSDNIVARTLEDGTYPVPLLLCNNLTISTRASLLDS